MTTGLQHVPLSGGELEFGMGLTKGVQICFCESNRMVSGIMFRPSGHIRPWENRDHFVAAVNLNLDDDHGAGILSSGFETFADENWIRQAESPPRCREACFTESRDNESEEIL
jgi:hypothetical protein